MNVPINLKCRKIREHKRKKNLNQQSCTVISAYDQVISPSSSFQSILFPNAADTSNIVCIGEITNDLAEAPKKRKRTKQSSPQIKEEIAHPNKKRKSTTTTTTAEEKQNVRQCKKLRLNDALSALEEAKGNKKRKTSKKSKDKDNNNNNDTNSVINEKVEESLSKAGWSTARIKAYKNKDKNPNAYYYRFNEPNETQRTGEWSIDEKIVFYNNIISIGLNYNWGLFSKNIQGRVGYQCSNFFRSLILSKDIYDSCYSKDSKGGITFWNSGKNDKSHYIILKPSENEIKDMLKEKCGDEVVVILPNIKDPFTEVGVVNPAVDKDGNCMNVESWKSVKAVYFILFI